MTVSKYRCTVGWGDCDPADIVFYPNYFRWFDEATWCLFESVGLTRTILRADYNCAGMPLLDARSKFVSPSRFHDALVIESRISAWRDKTFDVTHKVMNGANLAAEGQETRAWCEPHPDDPRRLKAQPIPKDVIAKLGG